MFHPSLWGEDLAVFIVGGIHDPIAGLSVPFGGFAVLYQRIVALIAHLFPLRDIEIVYYLSSLVAAWFTAIVIWLFAPIKSGIVRLLSCVAVVFMPSNTLPIWFTLVNTQWYLAIALALMVTSVRITAPQTSKGWLVALFLLCLTGPFSVLMAPVVALRPWVLKDLRRGAAFYATYAVATGLQALTIVRHTADRPSPGPADDSIHDWVTGVFWHGIVGFFTYGWLAVGGGLLIVAAGVLVWRRSDGPTRFQVFPLPFIAAVHMLAGYWSINSIPALIGPYGFHERYFVIPYGLGLLFILALGRGWLRFVMPALVILICVVGYRPFHHVDVMAPFDDRAEVGRSPTHWASYVDLSRYVKSVEVYGRPGRRPWTTLLDNAAPEPAPVDVAVSEATLTGGIIPLPAACSDQRSVALIFDYVADVDSQVQFNAPRGDLPEFSAWFGELRHLGAGSGQLDFAEPTSGVKALSVRIWAGVHVSNGRMLCYS